MKYHPGEQEKWDKKIVGGAENYGKPVGIVLDIGAHIGGFSVWAAKTADEVHAYEPEPENFSLLRENTKDLKNVITHNVAVGGKTESRTLYKFVDNIVNTGRYTFFGEGPSVDVKTVAFSEILDGLPRVDFLKCDCEGAEYEFLFGDLSKIGRMVIEAHYVETRPFKDLCDYIESQGFIVRTRPSDAASSRMIQAWKK